MKLSLAEKLRLFFIQNLEDYRIFVYLIGALALILGIMGLLNPVVINVPNNIAYQHSGMYAYSATAPAEIYPSGKVESGQVIFPAVTCQVDVAFYYAFSAPEPTSLQGTYHWTAELSSTNGWKQTVLSQPETSFTGSTLSTSTSIDVCQIESLIQQLEETTGVNTSRYVLSFSPNISINGEVSGLPIADSFSDPLVYMVEPKQIYLRIEDEKTNPLEVSQSGELPRWNRAVNNLSILSLKIPVPLARLLGVCGVFFALIALILPEAVFKSATESEQALKAKKALGTRLVEISELSPEAASHLIRVRHLEDLAGLADQLQEKVLLMATEQGVNYYVISGRTIYVYEAKE